MRFPIVFQRSKAVVIALAAVAASGCGEVARTGRSPAYLQLLTLQAASGAAPEEFSGYLMSDVITNNTYYNDVGRAEFRVQLKDPGPSTQPTVPSPLNAITLTRYRVTYVRSDGRNTQGVDVPYAFDGGLTLTVPASGSGVGTFNLVRQSAKLEPPLLGLFRLGGAQIINTIAQVSFYGRDQAGNDVEVAGEISVAFADFGDPQ